MKKKAVSIPKIVENDGYLKPFLPLLIARRNKIDEYLNKTKSKAKSLYNYASGHEYFGLHKLKDGWIIREWAPNASAIYLLGAFSNWQEHHDFKFERKNDGIFELSLPKDRLHHLEYYKLKVCWDGGCGERIPSYANYVVQDPATHLFCAQVWDPPKKFKFKNAKPIFKSQVPLIYEAHVGMGQEEGKVGTYKEFQDQVLPRVKKGGYNVLQLMAIQEHPYYGSFGYQVSNFFAPSSRFGTPDELKELIDTAHGMGLKVIMDIVHSHAVKNELEGLSNFDGTEYQYFHAGGKGYHSAWDTRCFDYGKEEVRHFLLSNCRYWIEEFNFDGFRFDGITSMLYHNHGLGQSFCSYDDYFSENVDEDCVEYLTLANLVIHDADPDAIVVAEDMSGMPGLAAPYSWGGVGFDYRLGMGIPDFWIKLLKHTKDEDWHMDGLYYEVTNRRNDEKIISYVESHDQALVGDKTIAFHLMDKEMYFNMSCERRNAIIDRGLALHKIIKLITISTAGGGYLNFMGNEFGHPEWIDFPRPGNNWSYHYARRLWSLSERDDLCYKFLLEFDRQMIHLIKNNNLITPGWPEILWRHSDDKVIVFIRGDLLFVFNFHPSKAYKDYMINAPQGRYQMILNSDAKNMGGYENVPNNLELKTFNAGSSAGHKLSLYLPPRVAFVMKRI